MPRYHFDLHEDGNHFTDEDGRDFDDDASARRFALRRLIDVLEALPVDDAATKLIVVVVKRHGEREPFAAISTRLTALA